MSDPVSLLASPIIEKLIGLAIEFGKNKYHQLYGVEAEFEKLISNLSTIAAVLKDAERTCTDSKSELLVDWLTKLRDAALDVEDLLETYATEVAIRKKGNLAPLAWISSRLKAANKIKKLVERIEFISQEKAKFHFKPEDYGGTQEPQPTRIDLRARDYMRDTSDIVGREEECEEIIKWLLSEETSDNNGCVPVLPIIGMGGLGKTTLAQLVYNDQRVHKKDDEACHFKVAVWVNVSVDSSFEKILNDMVYSLTEMRHDMIPESSIKSGILEALDGRRFLLVLDDVWVEKLAWEPLHDFLKSCPKGSKILVTSRNSNVARIMGATQTHTLGQLPEDKCWDLFAKKAFPDGTCTKILEEMGREIIHKCNYLPLAVKAMAGLLRANNNIKEWQRILRNGIWNSELEKSNLENRDPSILPALKMSYDFLPSQLKQPFAYCYLFSKGHIFDKLDLVKLWIGEGYIHPSREDKFEELGSDYFNELLSRSFFQILDIENKVRYKMHDLIHDLAKSVSSACHQVEENKPCNIEKTARHVSLLCKDVQTPSVEILKAKKLRTLVLPINYPRDFGQTLDKLFRAMKYMRVLDLSASNIIDLPKSIGELKLLKYLDLSRNEIRSLPNTICNLFNLQILRLLGCLWLQELPKDLGNLTNLLYLELDDMFWYKCSSLPSKIGGLTNLRHLYSFHVHHESGYGIDELKRMNNLEGTLHISKLENSNNAKEAELKQKEGLTKLILEWSKDDASNSQHGSVQERVLEDLEPHQSLEELQIHEYKGSRISSWMGNGLLHNIKKITLKNCEKCRIISLGPLPQLQELYIKGMYELVEWPDTLYPSLIWLTVSKCPQLQELPRIFPNTRAVKIKQCDALKALAVMPSVMFLTLIDNLLLEDWREPTRIHSRNQEGQEIQIILYSFINLLELKVVNCPRLQELPRVFSPQKLLISGCASLRTLPTPQYSQRLQCLELDKCNGSNLLEAIPSTNSLYSLIISNITNLPSLPNFPPLPGLKSLYINKCQDLVKLSHENGTLETLTALKFLSISGCPKLLEFPEQGLPSSIECLSIENCSQLKSFPTRNYLASLTSLKDFYLADCPKFETMPKDGFPNSLLHLSIQGCGLLTQKFNKNVGGRCKQMIRHVADLELDTIEFSQVKASLGPRKAYSLRSSKFAPMNIFGCH